MYLIKSLANFPILSFVLENANIILLNINISKHNNKKDYLCKSIKVVF